MHIPDGLMDPTVSVIGWIEFLVVLGAVLLLAGNRIKEKSLPRVAVLAAGIFVAQMLNFPIGGGTTGHLVGGALFAIIAGPMVAIIGMTVVLVIQALMFGDGGITAMGLNALNMAVIAPLTGWGVYTLLKTMTEKEGRKSSAASGFVVGAAAWASVFVAAAACAAELAVSNAVSSGAYGIAAAVSVPAMLGMHAVIGVGEGIITAGVLAYLCAVLPGSITSDSPTKEVLPGLRALICGSTARAVVAIILVFALALPLYFLYASAGKDGLEKTMEDANVAEGEPTIVSPFSYGQDYFSALFAGLLGFLAVALVALGIMKLVRMRGGRGTNP
ncbi:MAG: energy-coupling factor ABC transporter permease [Candidatus Thermoplasmatota archaeon]|nr:energy-coupling factor ABC transporter permease [Candidatus Thermoplasmatota archaeon]